MFLRSQETDFEILMESLRFRSTFEASRSLVSGHLGRVQSLLQTFIRTRSGVDSRIKAELARLPEESLLRLIASPYLCEMLMVREEAADEAQIKSLDFQILQALVAEIRRASPGFEHPIQPLWTANGDFVFDTEIAQMFPPLQTDCGIGLNYQSYSHNTGKPGIAGYTLDEALQLKERIETGKSIVGATSKEALSMVDQFTTIIQVRRNLQRPNIVNSSSHTSIGLIRCDNFHKLRGDMPEIVDMLVHESIHQYLHLFEEEYFGFVDVERIPDGILGERAYPSPWSGNPLDLRSYTHAILVWYGLAHFWNRYLEGSYEHAEVSEAAAKEKLSEAHVGFMTTVSVLDNLGPHKEFLNVRYAEQVERIQARLMSTRVRATPSNRFNPSSEQQGVYA